MKDTHTVQDLEKLMFEYAIKIRDARTKTEKTELLKELRGYEKQWNNVNDKNINGKKYPVRKVPKETSKKELLALIDSVPDRAIENGGYVDDGLDLSGVFVK